MLPLQLICTKKEDTINGRYTTTLSERLLCFAPWLMTTVDPFGSVYPCCFACTFQNLSDDLESVFWGDNNLCLGNVRRKSFRENWDGQGYRELRKKFRKPPHYKMCSWCYYRSSIYRDTLLTGLFKRRYLLFGVIFKRLFST